MNKVPKFLALALFSFAIPQSIVAADTPDMSGENHMTQQGRDRYNRLNSENREMKKQDQEMMKSGYDRNQKPSSSTKTDSSSEYKTQEARMRGELTDAATPRSYPINENYPFAPRNDNAKSQHKASRQKDSDPSYRQTAQARYYSNRQEIGDNSETMRSKVGANPNRDLKDDEDDDRDDADESSDSRANHSNDRPIADSIGANKPPRQSKQTESGSSRTSSSSYRRSGQR
jgi:hypothetical protein